MLPRCLADVWTQVASVLCISLISLIISLCQEEDELEDEEEDEEEDDEGHHEEDEGGKSSPSAKGWEGSEQPGEDDKIQKLISAKSEELDRGGKNVRTSGGSNNPKLVMVEPSMPSSDSE